jgi:ABC-2 type transport system ATP-binding protein
VSFSVEEGEFFGFIGPNGAGKSTTIRTLLDLIRPTSGTAELFGKDCVKHAPEIAREVGYLPSEVFYYDGMRVNDLLNYSASFYKKDCSGRIKELADALDLDLKKKIDDLSFGNRKKVGIVQALLHRPKLIILDEPSAGLDPLMQQRFFELLREENRAGATVLFSSHVLSEVQKLCSRVAIIKEGRIIEDSAIGALKENSYKRVALEAKAVVDGALFKMDGVASLTVHENAASFIFRGNVNQLMKTLSALELTNVTIQEPDLEEIFLHYYQ